MFDKIKKKITKKMRCIQKAGIRRQTEKGPGKKIRSQSL